MDELLGGLKRTHMCGQLRLSDVDKSAVVMGWVQRRRDLGGVIFIDLRDRTGIVQVVFNEIFDADAFDKAQALRNEYVIAVVGDVVRRSEDTVNPKINT
jgi:aspartyl-tRNA synthetase